MMNGGLRTERQVCDAFQNYWELWQTLIHTVKASSTMSYRLLHKF